MKAKFKLSNRILSLVLAVVMVLGMVPMTANAAAGTYNVGTSGPLTINSSNLSTYDGTTITGSYTLQHRL